MLLYFFISSYVFLTFFLFTALMSELRIERLRKMSTSNLPTIRSKIMTGDMSNVISMYSGSLGVGYILTAAPRDYTFYIMPKKLNEILVSIKPMRVGLSSH